MINFRNIFNLNYSYLVLFGICILFILIFFLLKDNKKFFKLFSNINLISGIITLMCAFILKSFVSNINNYKFFVQIISDNIYNELLYFSMMNLFIWIIAFIIFKVLKSLFNTN